MVHKDRQIDQWNGILTAEIDPHLYGLLGFSKGTKVVEQKFFCLLVFFKKKQIVMEQLDIHVRKKMDIFTAYTKMDWGLNIYLTIISKAIKLLEENISGYLCDMG